MIDRDPEPMLAWGRRRFMHQRRTVYLVPEYGTPDEAWAILEEGFDEIFTRELSGWHADESAWPQDMPFPMFKEWFEIEFNSMVEDLCGYQLMDDAC